MSTNQMAGIRKSIMSAEPGSPLWTSLGYRTYEADLLVATERAWREAADALSKLRVTSERERRKARHNAAKAVPCPSCGSPAGRNCRTKDGKSTVSHAARIQAAEDHQEQD